MTVPERNAQALLARAYGLKNRQEGLALYRDWAATYDRTMLGGLGYVSPMRAARMLTAALPLRRARVVDIGCGTGLAAIELAASKWLRIDGVDISPQMLAAARRRGIYGTLLVADLNQRLALPSLRYDAMICTGTFTHGHVGAGCMDELLRILHPGALFAFTVHRDVLEPLGFADKIQRLTDCGRMTILRREPGGYYETSKAPDGFYFLTRKR